MLFRSLVDEAGGGGEADSFALAAGGDTQGDGNVRLAGAGRPDQDDVLPGVQVVALSELQNGLLVEGGDGCELEGIEGLQGREAGPGDALALGIGLAGVALGLSQSQQIPLTGLVGAGGIGLQMQASLNVLAWPQVSLILLVILAAVLISEWVSAKVRGAII